MPIMHQIVVESRSLSIEMPSTKQWGKVEVDLGLGNYEEKYGQDEG